MAFSRPTLAPRALVAMVLLYFPYQAGAFSPTEFEITVDKPVFVLPQFTGPFREREASIAPEEYEKAEQLRSLLDSNQKDQVLKELEQFYDIELSPAMLTLKAQVYFSLRMYDKAEATYLAVLARKPQLVRAHSDLGQLYLIREDYKKARQYFANAVAFGSNEAIIHGQLAYLNLTMHGASSAISEYQQALALEPENPQWQQGLLAAFSHAKMYEAARALLGEMLAKHPDKPELWLNHAALSLQTEDFEEAVVGLEMAILLGDEDEKNLKTAARLHLQLHSYDRALALLKKILDKGSLSMEAVNECLTWLTQYGMWDQGRELLDGAAPAVARMDIRDQSLYYLHRARLENHQQKFAQAESYFRQSLEKDPTSGYTLLSYARFAAEQKEYVQAELLYIRAESIPEVEKQAILGRAQLYIDMQDYSSALKHLNIAYQKFPDMRELKGNIGILENIIRTKNNTGDSQL